MKKVHAGKSAARVTPRKALKLSKDPRKSAKLAGLTYVRDEGPCITRVRHGAGFAYRNPRGKPIHDRATLARIASLAIPPAWKDVWICPNPRGHLQAVGIDARGRKQYRYHPDWRAARDQTKYDKMIVFGRLLPRIRRRVARDLRGRGMRREKILATVVKLLESTLIRVGNEEYAKENNSFGLTTMHDRHVEVKGETIHFEFRGKSGVQHAVDLEDKRLAKIVRQCQEIPGHELFQFIDEAGRRHAVGSEDVNDYLKQITGEEFTAKDFRTWAGTVLAAMALREFETVDSEAQAKRNIGAAIASVAKRLGNTKAVCRKCYVHPRVFESYRDGSLGKLLAGAAKEKPASDRPRRGGGLRAEEAAVMTLLRRR